MTPSFIGRIAMMFPGVRPSISFASLPTASTFPVFWLIATMEGSLTTIPFPFAKTIVLAVPRSIARSFEKVLSRERGDQVIIGPLSTRKRLPAWIEGARALGDPLINPHQFAGLSSLAAGRRSRRASRDSQFFPWQE